MLLNLCVQVQNQGKVCFICRIMLYDAIVNAQAFNGELICCGVLKLFCESLVASFRERIDSGIINSTMPGETFSPFMLENILCTH